MSGSLESALPTILLVDDEREVMEGLKLLLRRQPYEIVCAPSAMEALTILARRRVAVVVSDEQMPGMSGSEFLGTIAERFPETARIMLTGKASLETAIRAINDGKIVRFLLKPCRSDDLVAAITEALRTSVVATATARLLDVARAQSERLSITEKSEKRVALKPHTDHRFGALDPQLLATLSLREREVLDLLIDGLRVSQVAKTLFVSPHTVRNHLKAIFQKLDIHSQSELLEKSRNSG